MQLRWPWQLWIKLFQSFQLHHPKEILMTNTIDGGYWGGGHCHPRVSVKQVKYRQSENVIS